MISPSNIISSERIQLIPCDETLLNKIIEGDLSIGNHLGISVAKGWSEFGVGPYEYTLRQIKGKPKDAKWWAYLLIHRIDQKLIGGAGYKGPPGKRGMVEIGYGIAPEYREKGYATEAAKALIEHAFTFKEVKIIYAHTLAEKNASGSILKKLGFVFMEEVLDPEDGRLSRWGRAFRN